MNISLFCLFWHYKREMSCSPKIRAYLRVQGFNINESPSGREVISLKKVDSLVALVDAREA
jgi:hypothetical protein